MAKKSNSGRANGSRVNKKEYDEYTDITKNPSEYFKNSAFHNPYTFWDFPESSEREERTLYSAGDVTVGTFSGILELEVTLESPLMLKAGYSNAECKKILEGGAESNNQESKHQTYNALTIEGDVIVPASSVRGSLRNLMTLITDGPLLRIDDIAYKQGRKSIKWKDLLKNQFKDNRLYPDTERSDGKVHLVTNLFGQVTDKTGSEAVSFAGRVRPENLVFPDTATLLSDYITLPVLNSPNPGCMAFYRKAKSADMVSAKDPLKGHKVYRNSMHAGIDDPDAPWIYDNQGMYEEGGEELKDKEQDNNFTAQLLSEKNTANEQVTGSLRLALRGVSERELAILLACCKTKWRLGGGKPFGLGLCTVKPVRLLNEIGEKEDIDVYSLEKCCSNEVAEKLEQRIKKWEKTQEPVERLLYPRAMVKKDSSLQRTGFVWFAKNTKLKESCGLESTYVIADEEEKKAAVIPGQLLPDFDESGDQKDKLFGNDVLYDETNRKPISIPGVTTRADAFKELKDIEDRNSREEE